jgi:hypothetical protein
MARAPEVSMVRKAALAAGAVLLVVAAWGLIRSAPEPPPVSVEQPFEIPTAAELAAMTPEQKAAIVDRLMAAMAELPPSETDEPLPADADAQPAVLAQGSFAALGEGREAAGEARLLELVDGTRVLRLEGFRVTNGPDLRVVLAAHGDPQSAADVEQGFADLGALKGSAGNQNYILPDGIDPALAASVVIWCRAFAVPFAAATLE